MVTAALPRHRRSLRRRGATIAGEAIVAVGKVIGFSIRISPSAVNLAGAAMASYGTALIYKPAGFIVGGLFLLAMGRQMETRTPRAGSGRGG